MEELAVVFPDFSPYWCETHKAGCADLYRGHRSRNPRADVFWTLEASTLVEAADIIAGDFIGESMTVDEAVDSHIHWMPCVHLPRGEVIHGDEQETL